MTPLLPRWRIGRAAHALGLSDQRVRGLVDEGELACERLEDGTRIFDPADVFALATRRAESKDSR